MASVSASCSHTCLNVHICTEELELQLLHPCSEMREAVQCKHSCSTRIRSASTGRMEQTNGSSRHTRSDRQSFSFCRNFVSGVGVRVCPCFTEQPVGLAPCDTNARPGAATQRRGGRRGPLWEPNAADFAVVLVVTLREHQKCKDSLKRAILCFC